MSYESIKDRLAEAGQGHLLRFWSELTVDERTAFLIQLDGIDYASANEVFAKASAALNVDSSKKVDGSMRPIPRNHFGSEESSSPAELRKYKEVGYDAISKGEVGVLLLAGGQGTRLGVDYPKGMYSLGLPSGKTLFQLQAERILTVEKLARAETGRNGRVTWFVMTSESTDALTRQFLSANGYFGLDANDVVQFDQGLLPSYDLDGSIILAAKNRVALSPDGNGGVYRALRTNNVLGRMKARGVRYVHVHSVDNALVKVADPVFVGYCLSKTADCGAKVVRKSAPNEPIGVVCQIDDRFQVVEYSEITAETANLRDDAGDLVFNAGSICNHFFTVEFLGKICESHDADLKLHVARKRISCVDDDGRLRLADVVKIEKFIFDVFEFSENFVTWEVRRRCEFSPLKNVDEIGFDCPATARADLFALHKRYVEEAGGKVDGEVVEVSSTLSYAGENLEKHVKGRVFETPVYVEGDDCGLNERVQPLNGY